jgi:hypothetical protein
MRVSGDWWVRAPLVYSTCLSATIAATSTRTVPISPAVTGAGSQSSAVFPYSEIGSSTIACRTTLRRCASNRRLPYDTKARPLCSYPTSPNFRSSSDLLESSAPRFRSGSNRCASCNSTSGNRYLIPLTRNIRYATAWRVCELVLCVTQMPTQRALGRHRGSPAVLRRPFVRRLPCLPIRVPGYVKFLCPCEVGLRNRAPSIATGTGIRLSFLNNLPSPVAAST